MRIGVYGGTFNPPHLGHLRAAQYALEALQLDRMLVIPDRIAPHKSLPEGSADPVQRLEMVKLCFADNDKIEVSDIELRREGTSYTYQTIEQLHAMYPKDQLVLMMGTDMFLSFLSWRAPEKILAHASLGVYYRGDKDEKAAVEKQLQVIRDMGAAVELVNNPVLQVSSTDLRRMLALGCAKEFLHPAVADYIIKNGLYGTNKNRKGLSEAELEKEVIALLKPSRVSHVLGCRQTAVELARLYGVSEVDAARAALLHDVTKALDGPLQLTLCRSYGTILDDFYESNPKTLHAYTGALAAKWVFGENAAVVDAVASHTTGKADMNTLEAILYVADYVEPNRDFPGVEQLRSLAYTDIYKALKLGLQMTMDMLRAQGREISPGSQQAIAWLEAKGI